jgi:hypothetical protein
MKSIILYLIFFTHFVSFGQNPTIQKNVIVEENVEDFINPEYPGGNKELGKFLSENAHIPDSVKYGLINGLVHLELTIDANGNIINQKAYGRCYACKVEAIRLVKLVPRFKPATKNGKNVNSIYKLPFRFGANPDSTFVYNNENLFGQWTIQSESKFKCPECPTILFNKNLTAKLISDSLNWFVKDNKLNLLNKGEPARSMYFLSNTNYKMTFSDYFRVLVVENSFEKYTLYKK